MAINTLLWLTALTSLSPLVSAKISYPATIELDILFPRNDTVYNNLTSFPVVFALQNAEAAYAFEWDIGWKMYNASPDARESDYTTGYSSMSQVGLNDFQYVFDGVALAPTTGYNFTVLKEGSYRLEWEYTVSTCWKEGKTTVYGLGSAVAFGELVFDVVTDGSGSGFDIPVDKCPQYGGHWLVNSATSSLCPFAGQDSDAEAPDPCVAKLTASSQVECLRDYFAGKNDTQACQGAFTVAGNSWSDAVEENSAVVWSVEPGWLVAAVLVARLFW